MKYRTGDVIRFRRGSHEYTGTIRSVMRTSGMLMLADTTHGSWVKPQDVVRVETPMLTEKEATALLALREHQKRYGEHTTVRDLALVRENGEVTGSCLSRLEKRGLVQSGREGVSGLVSIWGLTEEGRRVADRI